MGLPQSSGRTTRVYTIRRGQKVFCLIFMAFALTFLVAVLWGIAFSDKEADPWTILVGFVLVVGGGLITAEKFTTRLTLTQEEIRLGSVFGEKKLTFEKILGRRRYFDRGTDDFPGGMALKDCVGR